MKAHIGRYGLFDFILGMWGFGYLGIWLFGGLVVWGWVVIYLKRPLSFVMPTKEGTH
jgi:hypothetical protein